MPDVALVATGGTIASTQEHGGRTPTSSGRDLLAQAGLNASNVHDLDLGGSFAWSLETMRQVVERVRDVLGPSASGSGSTRPTGVVVTHGTDTMEETVFLASLLLDERRPVVFTGAQEPYDSHAPDGPGNLKDAFAVASSPKARGRGPLLCFDGSVFTARGVSKVETLSKHAFDAPGRGPALRVHDGRVTELHPMRPLPPLRNVPPDTGLPRVDIVASYPGADAVTLRASADAGAAGIVLAAPGTGNTTPAVVAEVARLTAAGTAVLVCSRVPSGPVLPLYAGGGGADLLAAGAVFGDDLSPWQGRLLLSVALAGSGGTTNGVVRAAHTVGDWAKNPS
ncbi:asparaginase [Streptomyces cyaneofuscatus]|uniref:asparaginase n=1 Tax=Streptomyces cyaneofuscatus TaxID=66883 RepID=UPI00366055C4